MDSHADFLDVEEESGEKSQQQDGSVGSDASAAAAASATTQPVNRKRLTSKSTTSLGNSLEMLDACLPEEPKIPYTNRASTSPASAVPSWLRQALFGGFDESFNAGVDSAAAAVAAVLPLTARLAPLAHRMRSLLLRGVYARRRFGKTSSKVGRWADAGRPAGFVGAGLAEELCLAVFGRIQGLRAQGVGKQVGSFCTQALHSALCLCALRSFA